MRLSGDDLAVLRFVDVEPGSFGAKVALGRLLSEPGIRLVAGCPLMAYLTGGELSAEWRASYPAHAASLWSELELMASLLGADMHCLPGADPYEALCELRARSEAEMSGFDDLAA